MRFPPSGRRVCRGSDSDTRSYGFVAFTHFGECHEPGSLCSRAREDRRSHPYLPATARPTTTFIGSGGGRGTTRTGRRWSRPDRSEGGHFSLTLNLKDKSPQMSCRSSILIDGTLGSNSRGLLGTRGGSRWEGWVQRPCVLVGCIAQPMLLGSILKLDCEGCDRFGGLRPC